MIKNRENLKIPQWNFFQMVWNRVDCVFVMIATHKKKFSQKLEGENFKVEYNLHRGCFQKNVNSLTMVKAKKLFILQFIYVISHLQKMD